MIIGTTTLGESRNTLGLSIVADELKGVGFQVVEVDASNAREVDILCISLFWADQVIDYPRWLAAAKINPGTRKPIIIIGGSMTLNPSPLKGMFDYLVIGDGEKVLVALIKELRNGNDPAGMKHILSATDVQREIYTHVCFDLPMNHYVENRTNKITRIEIARGCKHKCSFCQLSHVKPYRELPPIVLKNLIATSPTKNIALFSPDRGSYSAYQEIERWCYKYKKRNLGTDIRLSSIRKTDVATNVRFGIEGFSERERKYLNKPYSNTKLVDDIYHIFENIRTPKGKNITAITAYMIIGTPNQTRTDFMEFSETLHMLDVKCQHINRKLTLFLTLNDFTACCHTGVQDAEKDIFENQYSEWMKYKPRLKNITIAQHGGKRSFTRRIAQHLVFRGGENSNKAIFNLSFNYKKLLADQSIDAAKKILSMIKKCGCTDEFLTGYKQKRPWDNIKISTCAT